MAKKGMITFGSLGDYRNAIVLCASCHNRFDRTSNTGWVFLPTYLDWFIEWEERDFANRKEILEQTGREIERTYPSEQDYENHLRAIGILLDPDDGMCRGGFYNSYILEDMFPPLMMTALEQKGMVIPGIFPGGPKPWHGSPMAAINRGFVVTGAPEVKLPEEEWELLHKLQRLYTRKLPKPTGGKVGPGGTLERGSDIHHEATVAGRQQGNANLATESAGPGNQGQSGGLRDAQPPHNCSDSAIDARSLKRRREVLGVDEDSWCFGPDASSNDKIEMHIGKRRCAAVPEQIANKPTDSHQHGWVVAFPAEPNKPSSAHS